MPTGQPNLIWMLHVPNKMQYTFIVCVEWGWVACVFNNSITNCKPLHYQAGHGEKLMFATSVSLRHCFFFRSRYSLCQSEFFPCCCCCSSIILNAFYFAWHFQYENVTKTIVEKCFVYKAILISWLIWALIRIHHIHTHTHTLASISLFLSLNGSLTHDDFSI